MRWHESGYPRQTPGFIGFAQRQIKKKINISICRNKDVIKSLGNGTKRLKG